MRDHPADLAAVRRLGLLLLCAALAGCGAAPRSAPVPASATGGGGAAPRQAILYRDTVTVQFSDASLCVAIRPGAARQWSGTLQGCPHLLPYRVELPAGRLAPRRVLVRTEGGGTTVLSLENAAFGLPGGV
ncbi:hypothetical protein [Oceaniglobus roseus]|uniref:hypothetical protein n=1 Tax=Oceaniglobus roseus TaxID=1737570 RepID=UPI00130015C7|nr:hypothetical protein [Kandeliimicrobium roseum]